MKRLAPHLARLLDAVWYVSMGLFLGLTAGLVLAVILTFKGARAIQAVPGAEPFSDPQFAEYHHDAVAGYIGQELFRVGGTVAAILLAIAIVGRVILSGVHLQKNQLVGSRVASGIRLAALFFCVSFFAVGALTTYQMNRGWPGLYDLDAENRELVSRRNHFESQHTSTEQHLRYAWLCGLIALSISPWCRRTVDAPTKNESTSEQ